MKTVDPDFQAALESGTTTLCHCWKLTRVDGKAFGFTDHDRPLAFNGVTFEADAGMSAGAMDASFDLSVDNLDVVGALNSDHLNAGDLSAGLFDDASIEIWRVNWQDVSQRLLMRVGNLGEVGHGRSGFRAEVRGLAHRLNQPVGRLFQHTCDANLGDGRCGVDVTVSAFRALSDVTSVSAAGVLTVASLSGYDPGWFSGGILRFTDGSNEGVRREIKSHTRLDQSHLIGLWEAPPHDIEAGAGVELTAGCDKLSGTCRTKFSNLVNFRGFPHMPGNDFVLFYPAAGGGHDGTVLS